MGENVKILRECPAVVVPGGEQFTLEEGTDVEICQALGGDYTVLTNSGYLVRISGLDADALGKPVQKMPTAEEAKDTPIEKLVWDQLKTCYDPEIPVDIANLGLVYKCEITQEEAGYSVLIHMTLTAPGCGMGDVLRTDVQRKLEKVPGITKIQVELVWEPVWSQSMMSDAAKLKLGML